MEQTLEAKLINTITAAISNLPPGKILTAKAANEIAYDLAKTHLPAHINTNSDPIKTLSLVHKELAPFYSSVRMLIAQQFKGLTLEDIVETVLEANRVFFNKSELSIVPIPSLAFTGYCEPFSLWNLYCNAGELLDHAHTRNCNPSLYDRLSRVKELLGFLLNNDISIEDIKGSGFDGNLRIGNFETHIPWSSPEFTQQVA